MAAAAEFVEYAAPARASSPAFCGLDFCANSLVGSYARTILFICRCRLCSSGKPSPGVLARCWFEGVGTGLCCCNDNAAYWLAWYRRGPGFGGVIAHIFISPKFYLKSVADCVMNEHARFIGLLFGTGNW